MTEKFQIVRKVAKFPGSNQKILDVIKYACLEAKRISDSDQIVEFSSLRILAM
jgi:hypothetical protein